MQAQEPRAARLAFRARSRGPRRRRRRPRADRGALAAARLVMRKTVHLIATEDAGWLLPLFSPTIVRWSRKRLADFGLDRRGQERALALLHRAVDEEGAADAPGARPSGSSAPASRPRTSSRSTCGCWRRSTASSASAPTAAARPASCGPPTGSASPSAGRERTRWPSSRAATCAPTRRPTSATWRAGLGCRCATRGPGSSGSPRSCEPAGELSDARAARRGRHDRRWSGCSAPSTTTTSATSTADFAIAPEFEKRVNPGRRHRAPVDRRRRRVRRDLVVEAVAASGSR